jgi:hypothetical protein
MLIPREPSGKVVTGVEVRQDGPFEQFISVLVYFLFSPFIPDFFRHRVAHRPLAKVIA